MSAVKKRDPRRNDLAQIHIAKKDLGLDDETYRAMLFTVARVRSSSDLDHAGRRAVLEHMKARGWKNNRPKAAEPKQRLMGKIEAMLKAQQRTIEYADGIAKRMFNVAKVQWCTAEQLRKIVAALNYNKQRQEKKPE